MLYFGWIFGVICLVLSGIFSMVYHRKMQNLSQGIQELLEKAISGQLPDVHLDESNVASIENDMWRYLHDRAVSEQELRDDLAHFQSKISDISHQAVMPISNIMLYAALIEEQIDEVDILNKSELMGALAAVQEEVRSLDALIGTLTRYARTETGMIRVYPVKQPIQLLLSMMMMRFQAMANQKGITFLVEKSSVDAVYDMKWTVEALANVIDNGLKYTVRGGIVKVDVEEYPTFVRINVTDDGIGIAEAEQAAIFKRFYRSEMVSNRDGVGLGLYVAREVMRAQGGFIKVCSEVQKGSVFSLFFLKNEISQN
jgi:signal transduction histidine kinase